MSEDSKKKQQKRENGPKEQRRTRQRNQAGPAEQKTNNASEKLRDSPTTHKQVSDEPGPDFFNKLKRETDDILKITEEENSKYKKKEIQSNWAKYEMPIETYDEIQEQENMGADYEKLIEAPLSIGGHFQFKHEKSWGIDIKPSPYQKYFEVDMDILYLAISSIPFHERTNTSRQLLSDMDMTNMNSRANRYLQKYTNDLKTLKMNFHNDKSLNEDELSCASANSSGNNILQISENKHNTELCTFNVGNSIIDNEKDTNLHTISIETTSTNKNSKIIDFEIASIDEVIIDNSQVDDDMKMESVDMEAIKQLSRDSCAFQTSCDKVDDDTKIETSVREAIKELSTVSTLMKNESQKNPLMESPEDLEKWLDDFLDD